LTGKKAIDGVALEVAKIVLEGLGVEGPLFELTARVGCVESFGGWGNR
jgi:hypothetical protein